MAEPAYFLALLYFLKVMTANGVSPTALLACERELISSSLSWRVENIKEHLLEGCRPYPALIVLISVLR